MADELDATLNEPSEAEKRIKQLSGKVKETSEEREKAEARAKEAEEKASQAQKLATFSEGFVDIVTEIPAAKEFKDQLKEKVLGGMSMDDAKVWIMGKTATTQKVEIQSPAGGAASPTISTTESSNKKWSQMNSDELRAKLVEAEQSGELGWR